MNKWLNQTVLRTSVSIGLFVSDKEFRAELKRLKITTELAFPMPDNATTWLLKSDDGKNKKIAMICMNIETKDIVEIHALIAHEVVHVLKFILDDFKIQDPDEEFAANALQRLFLTVATAWEGRKKCQ